MLRKGRQFESDSGFFAPGARLAQRLERPQCRAAGRSAEQSEGDGDLPTDNATAQGTAAVDFYWLPSARGGQWDRLSSSR